MCHQADLSSVTAGGIVTFHPSPIAVRLQGNDRLCDSLILSVQESFPASFDVRTPAVARLRLRGVPSHSAVWTFLSDWIGARIRIPRYIYIIPQKPRHATGFCLDRNFFPKNLRCTDFIHSGTADWTFPFHCGFAIFHGHFNSLRIVALCAAFYTVHACHILVSPPFTPRSFTRSGASSF